VWKYTLIYGRVTKGYRNKKPALWSLCTNIKFYGFKRRNIWLRIQITLIHWFPGMTVFNIFVEWILTHLTVCVSFFLSFFLSFLWKDTYFFLLFLSQRNWNKFIQKSIYFWFRSKFLSTLYSIGLADMSGNMSVCSVLRNTLRSCQWKSVIRSLLTSPTAWAIQWYVSSLCGIESPW
jgi:hypothetical protein